MRRFYSKKYLILLFLTVLCLSLFASFSSGFLSAAPERSGALSAMEELAPLKELSLSAKKEKVLRSFFEKTPENDVTRKIDRQLQNLSRAAGSASFAGAEQAQILSDMLRYQREEEVCKILSEGNSSMLSALNQQLNSKKATAAIKKAEKLCVKRQESLAGYQFQKGNSFLSRARYASIQKALTGDASALDRLSLFAAIQNSAPVDSEKELSLLDDEFLPKAKGSFEEKLSFGEEGLFARSQLEFFIEAKAIRSQSAASYLDEEISAAENLRTNDLSRRSGRILDAHLLWLKNKKEELSPESNEESSYHRPAVKKTLKERLENAIGNETGSLSARQMSSFLYCLKTLSDSGNTEASALLQETLGAQKYQNLCIFSDFLPDGEENAFLSLASVSGLLGYRYVEGSHSGEVFLYGDGGFFSFMPQRRSCLLSKTTSRALQKTPLENNGELYISQSDAQALFGILSVSTGSGVSFVTDPSSASRGEELLSLCQNP